MCTCNFTSRNNISLPLHSIQIYEVENREKKLQFMRECDNAFTISVIDRKNFSELFEKINKYAKFLAVEYDQKQVGYAAVYINNKSNWTAYITLFCISKRYQRLHFGTTLMIECFGIARAAGMTMIKLEVLKQDISTICFYESCGFRYEGNASEQSIYLYRAL